VSWYRLILAAVAAFIISMGTVQAKELQMISEDELIIRGLLYTEYRAYENSRLVFGKLYDMTQEKEYLFREMASSLLGRTHIAESIERLKVFDEAHPDLLDVKRLLIPLYLTNQQIKEAKNEADYLIERSEKAGDLDLAANPYLYSGEFKKAVDLLQRAYEKSNDEDVLLRMVAIMDEYTGQRKRAIQLLETHRRMNMLISNDIYFKLLALYVKENDVDGVLSIYQALYEFDKSEEYLDKIIRAYAFKGDVDGAIAFLEKNKTGEKTLYQLYKAQKSFGKAMKLAQKFYEKEKDPKWLAEIAILTYEQAKDKNDQKMIEKVVKTFDKALAQGVDDSIYLNYYGYTLIDKDIDVKKGMKILQNALNQQPDNTYYLDSLAWGYYKEGECKKAYELMEKVIAQEGLKEPEIVQHWDMIKKCQ
jgi:tetratricopeptide (TPR) repeat protein